MARIRPNGPSQQCLACFIHRPFSHVPNCRRALPIAGGDRKRRALILKNILLCTSVIARLTTHTHGYLEGETATEARQRVQRASGETAKEARLRTDQAAGFVTSSESRTAREVAYATKHGHARLTRSSIGVSRDGVPFLQMEHISKIKWQYDFTGSDGTVSPHEMAIRTLPLTRSMASGQTIGFPSDGSRPPNNFKRSRRAGFTQEQSKRRLPLRPFPAAGLNANSTMTTSLSPRRLPLGRAESDRRPHAAARRRRPDIIEGDKWQASSRS